MTTNCPRLKRLYLHAALIGTGLLIVPFFLRRKARVLRRIIIKASPAEVFPLLNDFRNWPRWTEWSRLEEIRFFYEGPPAGAGAVQSWSSRSMEGTMRLVQSVPDEQVIYHTDLGRGNVRAKYHVDGILTLEAVGEATRVTWMCRWDCGPNPYARYGAIFMKRFIGRGFAAGLANLKELLEGPPAAS